MHAKWNGPFCTAVVTIHGQCVSRLSRLKITSAGTGLASRDSTCSPRPPSRTTSRASHSGVASQNSGGTTMVSSRCWNMWAE